MNMPTIEPYKSRAEAERAKLKAAIDDVQAKLRAAGVEIDMECHHCCCGSSLLRVKIGGELVFDSEEIANGFEHTEFTSLSMTGEGR